jgi:hypothetical protein
MLKHTLIRNAVLLFLCISGIGMGSCTKKVTQVVNQGFSAIYNVKASGWKVNSTGTYINYEFAVPELDQIMLDHGGVSVYLSFDGGDTYEALPEVVKNVAYGSYHYLHVVGIDLSPADNTGTVIAPKDDLLAKVVLLDAQPLD